MYFTYQLAIELSRICSRKRETAWVSRVLDLRAIRDLSGKDCLSTNAAYVPSAEVDSSSQLRRGRSFKENELSRIS
jgi:hypothetical protein